MFRYQHRVFDVDCTYNNCAWLNSLLSRFGNAYWNTYKYNSPVICAYASFRLLLAERILRIHDALSACMHVNLCSARRISASKWQQRIARTINRTDAASRARPLAPRARLVVSSDGVVVKLPSCRQNMHIDAHTHEYCIHRNSICSYRQCRAWHTVYSERTNLPRRNGVYIQTHTWRTRDHLSFPYIHIYRTIFLVSSMHVCASVRRACLHIMY